MKNNHGVGVSIGLGVYNEEKKIKKMLNSIIQQTHTKFELLISDDCSTDKTYEICLSYSKKDERIKLFSQKKNLGVAKNLAFLVENSKYDYFLYLAGDDFLSQDYIKNNLDLLIENSNCSFAASPHIWEDQKIDQKINFSLQGNLFDRLNNFLKDPFNATSMNYAIYRINAMRNCPELSEKFLGHDWKIMCNGLKNGNFLRSREGLITLGRGGISSAPEFMKSEQNRLIEIFCPLYEFSKYFCSTFIFKSNLSILHKLKLFFKLAKINLQLAFVKPINFLRFLKKGRPHHKIGPAYKNK